MSSTAYLTFSPDGRWIARSAICSGAVIAWNVETGTRHPLCPESYFTRAQMEQDGLLTISTDGGKDYYNWRTSKKTGEAPARIDSYSNLFYSSDKRLQAFQDLSGSRPPKTSSERPIIVREAASGHSVARFLLNDYCQCLQFTADNYRLVGVTSSGMVHYWDIESNKEIWSQQLSAQSFRLAGAGKPQISTDGRWLALGCTEAGGDGNRYAIRIFDLQAKKEHTIIKAPYYISGGICISPDGRFVAGGGYSLHYPSEKNTEWEAVFVWEIATGKRIHTLSGHQLGLNPISNSELSCHFSPDGRKLLTIDGRGTMRLWELCSGQVMWQSAENHGAPDASFSPDGGVIVSSSFDAPVLLWDLYGNAKGSVKPAGSIDVEQLWNDLASDDASKAFKSIRQLCAVPEHAIKLLREKLTPTKPRAEGAVAQWIKELDSPIFAERERASRELLNLLEEVEPQLRQVRAATTSDETRRRIEAILLKAGKPSPDRLRQERALDILEHLGVPEAKQHLETLAKGGANTPLTLGAQAALARMASLKAQP